MTKRFGERNGLGQMGVVVAVFLSIGAAKASVAEMKIGTVDMQKAIQSVDQGKTARSELETEFNKKKKELQAEESAIKKLHEDFQKKSLLISDQERAKKQAEIQERILKFQEATARSQTELQRKEAQLTEPIVTKLRDIIKNLAQKKEYTVVLEKNENQVLFSLEKDNLTSEVIALYNSGAKDAKKADKAEDKKDDK